MGRLTELGERGPDRAGPCFIPTAATERGPPESGMGCFGFAGTEDGAPPTWGTSCFKERPVHHRPKTAAVFQKPLSFHLWVLPMLGKTGEFCQALAKRKNGPRENLPRFGKNGGFCQCLANRFPAAKTAGGKGRRGKAGQRGGEEAAAEEGGEKTGVFREVSLVQFRGILFFWLNRVEYQLRDETISLRIGMHTIRQEAEGWRIVVIHFNHLAFRHLGDFSHVRHDFRAKFRVFPVFFLPRGERGGSRKKNVQTGDGVFEPADEPKGIGKKFAEQVRMGNFVDAEHDDHDIRLKSDGPFEFSGVAPCTSRPPEQCRRSHAEIADFKRSATQFGQIIRIGHALGTRGMCSPCRAVADTCHAKFARRVGNDFRNHGKNDGEEDGKQRKSAANIEWRSTDVFWDVHECGKEEAAKRHCYAGRSNFRRRE